MPQLGCNLRFRRQPRPLFDEVFAEQRRVPRRAAREERHARERGEIAILETEAFELHTGLRRVDAAGQRALHRVRLLEDFLEHEVRVPVALDRLGVHRDGRRAPPDRAPIQPLNARLAASQNGDVPFFEHDRLEAASEQRRDVGREKRFVVAEAQHQRRPAAAHGDEHVGTIFGDARDGERAFQLLDRSRDGLDQIAAGLSAMRLDEVRDDLGVGLRPERVPLRRQRRAKLLVVLDNAVVDDGQAVVAIDVRMRVHFAGTAMRRPARVRNPQRAGRRADLRELRLEVRDLAEGLADLQAVAVDRRHARGIVSAVLEPLEGGHEHVDGCARADVSDYAAHTGFTVRSPSD